VIEEVGYTTAADSVDITGGPWGACSHTNATGSGYEFRQRSCCIFECVSREGDPARSYCNSEVWTVRLFNTLAPLY